ncbi:MAG: tetratricopeptide repeat protein [Acidobacteriota bacterium]|nr:tetratricopeptide repeat protein [Acidobacteriota bacterium]
MFLSLLLVMLTLQPVQDDVSSWMKLIESGQLEQVEAEIRQHPEQATPIIEELLSQFDSSVHSWRDRPEQRRVRYSDDLLQSGLELTRLVTELTGDNTFERRFEARRDRVRATQMLNDGEFDEAMALIESVRDTARELEDQSFLFSTYLSSAYAFLGTGRPDKALIDCELALSLAREIGERVNLTLALFNLGTAHLHLGNHDESLTYSLQAAEAASEIGNKIWQANAWLNVGYVQIMKDQYGPAIESLRRTRSLSQEAGDPLGEGRAWYNLGIAYFRLRQWESTRDHLEHALEFIREVDIRHSHDITEFNTIERDALQRLLHSYQQLNLTDRALLEPIEQRLEEFEQMSDQGGEPGHSH